VVNPFWPRLSSARLLEAPGSGRPSRAFWPAASRLAIDSGSRNIEAATWARCGRPRSETGKFVRPLPSSTALLVHGLGPTALVGRIGDPVVLGRPGSEPGSGSSDCGPAIRREMDDRPLWQPSMIDGHALRSATWPETIAISGGVASRLPAPTDSPLYASRAAGLLGRGERDLGLLSPLAGVRFQPTPPSVGNQGSPR
jgi:hypothetical protein